MPVDSTKACRRVSGSVGSELYENQALGKRTHMKCTAAWRRGFFSAFAEGLATATKE